MSTTFKQFLGIDNGVSGALALICDDGSIKWSKMPIKYETSYQKVEKHLNRVDVINLRILLNSWKVSKDNTMVLLERPMVNPARFQASLSAIRALEATLIILEEYNLNFNFIDSKTWQRVLLPNVEGSKELKKASKELGCKMFPTIKFKPDADAIFIAYYGKYSETLNIEKPKPKKIKTL